MKKFIAALLSFALLVITPTTAAQSTEDLPTIGSWQLEGSIATTQTALNCLQGMPEGAFILGADPATCEPGDQGASAAATLTIPPAAGARIVQLHINCPGENGCEDALTALPPGGAVTITIDGQTLWTARCDSSGLCDDLALGASPTIALVTTSPTEHKIRILASPYVKWAISTFTVESRELPSTIQGIAYSPFRDCQNPNWGPFPTAGEISEDMLVLRNMGNAIRTYSSVGVQGEIPQIARQNGLRVSAGGWLGRDLDVNETEVEALIQVSQNVSLESAIIGNEVLLRHDLTEDQLIDYIERVKAAVDVPVTSAEVAGILVEHPDLMNALDYYLVHIYAYWEGVRIEDAARYVVDKYHEIQALAGGKRVVIGETGWPSAGQTNGDAVPSPENQRRFLREFLTLAQAEGVEFYYFAAFNELWKGEGGVGPFWGMLDADRLNLYDINSVLVPLNDQPSSLGSTSEPVTTGTPAPATESSNLFPVYTDYGVYSPENPGVSNHFAPSGWMGDLHTIQFNDCARAGADWKDRAIEIQYTPSANDPAGWAGIYWQEPDGNWGTMPDVGFDLRGYSQIRFRARSDTNGGQVKFLVGGINVGDFPSSITTPLFAHEADAQGFVTLSTEWHEYHIDLRSADLSHVIDGFGWTADRARTPDGVTVYLDNIVFDTEPPPFPVAVPPVVEVLEGLPIYVGQTFTEGYDMGVDTSEQQRDWVTDMGGSIQLAYPPGQDWGAVFMTVGKPVPPGQRTSQDFSGYYALAVDLRGEQGGEIIYIGIKDSRDPDNGTETKLRIRLTNEWQTFVFPLSRFASADLTSIYIPIEFVFEPEIEAETIYFRNVRYLEEPLEGQACTISASREVNLRSGPGTDFAAVGVLPANQGADVSGQAAVTDGFTWWQLSSGAWVRSDIVNADITCDDVPTVSP